MPSLTVSLDAFIACDGLRVPAFPDHLEDRSFAYLDSFDTLPPGYAAKVAAVPASRRQHVFVALDVGVRFSLGLENGHYLTRGVTFDVYADGVFAGGIVLDDRVEDGVDVFEGVDIGDGKVDAMVTTALQFEELDGGGGGGGGSNRCSSSSSSSSIGSGGSSYRSHNSSQQALHGRVDVIVMPCAGGELDWDGGAPSPGHVKPGGASP